MTAQPIRLTTLSHGGGCGCKLAPAVLEKIVKDLPRLAPSELLVGIETGDDAAVYRLNDHQAVVATTDFFTPIVDDPNDFGRIAATNAISDVYAMGARPIFALAVVGMPVGKMPAEVMAEIMRGAADVAGRAGIIIAGGHSIDTLEPIFGLVVLGLVHPDNVKKNSTAKEGDVLIISKPLGIGILSAAFKKGTLTPSDYAIMVDFTTRLNTPGLALADLPDVHAMTDVTGFGLLGHLLEMCRPAGLTAEINFSHVPLIGSAEGLARGGTWTGASGRNWDSYGREVDLAADCPDWKRNLLCDPQTSGGLLIATTPESGGNVLELLHTSGFPEARIIGHLATKGAATVSVSG